MAKEREQKRLIRKKGLALQQADQFEDELSNHELNKLRLEAIPQAERDEEWEQAIQASDAAIKTLKRSIETTLKEAGQLPAS